MKKLLFAVLSFVFSCMIQAQSEPNNCVNAINVRGNGIFSLSASSVGTVFNKVTESDNRNGKTVWLKVKATASGTLGFDMLPKNPEAGLPYNFWVYGPNRDCSNLGKPIRSCTVKGNEISRSNNRIGMNGNAAITQTNSVTGNGYVQWLDVTEGEFYYIRIDRPTADAGFDLQWTGSAANIENTEASRFSPPPVGVIDLVATISSSAGTICLGDTVTITITGTPYATVKYNIDGGTEQTIILDDSGIFTFSDTPTATRVYGLTSIKVYDSIGALLQEEVLDATITVTVQALPIATISGTAVICSGETAPVTFSGTPESTVTYNFNDGSDQQIVLDASGTATISATTAGTYTLVRVATPGTFNCSQDLSGSAVITVLPAPTVKITGTTTICSGETATITLNGTPNSTVTYTFNGGAEQEIVLNALGTATLSTSTAGTYALVQVTSSGALVCTRDLTDSVTVTVNPLPTAIIGGTTTICEGESANVMFIGTPNSIVTYTINGGSEEQITLNAFGSATISVSETGTYSLVRVTSPGPPGCSQALSDSATITVVPLPTAIITSTETICTGESGIITFTGTPLATITYTVNGGLNQQVVLDASGIATLQTTTAGTYTLVRGTTSGTRACTQPLTGSTTITIKPRPTAVITGTTTICSGESATITFTGTPNCTVTYTLNEGAETDIVLSATGTATLSVNETGTYTLVRVTTPGIPGCPQELNGSATVTVLPLPTATITSTETICSGETAIVTFTGTPLATVFYRINGGSEQQIILNGSGTGTLSTSTTSTYTLVRITTSGVAVCSQNLTGATTITIKPKPVAVITGTATICPGESATITFAGTPNCRVVYTIDGGSEQEIVLNASGAATLSVSETGTYTLVRATTSGTPGCSQDLSGSVTVTVLPSLTATILGTATICSGETATITFTGTPRVSVTYTVDGGQEQEIILNDSGTGTVSTTTAGTYALVRATTLGAPVCSQNITGSATVTLKELPTATISGTTTVCSGEAALISFTGTPGSTITYTFNGGTETDIVLNDSGTATVSTTTAGTYALVRATASGIPACSQNLTGSAVITVKPLPTATVTGTATICSGATTTITFNGTANAVVTYTVDGGVHQQIALDASGTATISTGTAGTYTLVGVLNSETPICSQELTDSATITVIPRPTATISGTTTICSGEVATVTFTGTPNSTVTYTFTGGAEEQIVLDASGTATISTGTAGTYTLVRITTSGIPACSQNLTGSATITVNSLPTATITGTTTICSGNTTTLTFTGTANAVVTYTINGGENETIQLDGSGVATLTTSVLTTTTVYTLVSVTGVTTCSQSLTDAATVTILPLPTATISGTRMICSGTAVTITFTGTPNAIVTYTVDGGSNQTITLDENGTASLTTPALTADRVYNLVSIVGVNTCSQNLTGSATITITLELNAAISEVPPICSGSTATVNFTGTPNAVVTYTVDGGANQTITLDENGMTSLITPTLTTNSVYNLIRVTLDNNCSQEVTGSTTITVMPLPTATISGTTTVCSGATATINFTGTANAVVTYTIDGGANQTITLDGNGMASLITPVLTTDKVYALVSVTGSNTCLQNLTGSVMLTIYPVLNATISGTATICSGKTATITFNGTANAVVTYSVNSGTPQTITLDSSGTATITSGATSVYELLSVADQNCNQSVNGMATITVVPLTAPTITFSYDSVCVNAVASPQPITVEGFTTGGTFSSTTIAVDPLTGVLDLTNAVVGTHLITYNVAVDMDNCIEAGHSEASIALTASPVMATMESGCKNGSLLLKAIPVNGSYDPEAVVYTWKDQNGITAGTNEDSFNVDEYMAQNPTATLPQTFKVIIADDCVGSVAITVTSNTCRMIPKGISPNNDGLNDTFDLSGMNIQELKIFNRYGREVYKFQGKYTNQWSGMSGNGNELPDGTYFYVIVKEDGTKVTGWVYVNRQR